MIEILKQNFENLDVKYKKRDKLMPLRGTLNIDKARDLLNYQPSWSLEKGYPNYINWYKKYLKFLMKINKNFIKDKWLSKTIGKQVYLYKNYMALT